jgi:hypothetical protein
VRPDDLLPPGEHARRRFFAALGLVRPVTMSLHPPGLVAQRIQRTLPSLLTEAVMQWRARERSRIRVTQTLDLMDLDAAMDASMAVPPRALLTTAPERFRGTARPIDTLADGTPVYHVDLETP